MTDTRYLKTFLITTMMITFVTSHMPQRITSTDPCTSKENCQECIQAPSCSWCYDPKFADNARCYQQNHSVCPEEYILNPDNILTTLQALELTRVRKNNDEGGAQMVDDMERTENNSDSTSTSGHWRKTGGAETVGQIVQVSPQKLNLKLRARQPYSIYMSYTVAEDYPVDLYYIMGFTKTAENNKEKLSSLGEQLVYTMKNLTSNFRLGFGSFVSANLTHPCEDCDAHHGFKHAMKLSNNTQNFLQMVKEANLIENLDAPGVLNSIMQAVVCQDQIGWRKQARRLLVFATDARFHYEKVEKLGITSKPNDGQCHLSEERNHFQSSRQDYPSIKQIGLKVKSNSVNVIFAVTESNLGMYVDLTKSIEGAMVGKQEGDFSNIRALIEEQYEQISSIVELKHNASTDVSITFFTRCLNSMGALVNTNICGNLKVGDIIDFQIEIEVLKCPEKRSDYFQTIQIYPVGINESLTIDLELICECDCEKTNDRFYMENATACNYLGTYKCGVCECYPGSFGKHCECIMNEIFRNTTTPDCIPPDNSGSECSGRGQCICGVCECELRENFDEQISGKYCECDNFSCERNDGELCSGPEHGICNCGVCNCKDDWTGSNCACKKSNATCYAPGVDNGKLCSGHGICECGVCRCETAEEGRYSGKFCEKCPTCSGRCMEFKDCVQCQQYKTGPLKDQKDCIANCTKFVPIAVVEVIVDENNNENLCTYYDDDECRFEYVYYFDNEKNIQVRAQQERKCPDKDIKKSDISIV